MRQLSLCLLVFGYILTSSCKKELSASGSPAVVTLAFTSVSGIAPLALDSTYTSTAGEQFRVSAFKYYVSDVRLFSKNGAFLDIPDIYHLVDASDIQSQSISFPASIDSMVAVSYLIGIDSALNVNQSTSGDLSPSKGMWWSSTAGYIMARLDGTSPASTGPSNTFQYDIGGFSGPNSALRIVTLALPGAAINLQPGATDSVLISIDADVDAWFMGPHTLLISSSDTCLSPGPLASAYADNYARMFTIRNVQVK